MVCTDRTWSKDSKLHLQFCLCRHLLEQSSSSTAYGAKDEREVNVAQFAAAFLVIPCTVHDSLDGRKPVCSHTNGAVRYYFTTRGFLVLDASASDHKTACRRLRICSGDGQRPEGEVIPLALFDRSINRLCEPMDIRLLLRTCCRDLVHTR